MQLVNLDIEEKFFLVELFNKIRRSQITNDIEYTTLGSIKEEAAKQYLSHSINDPNILNQEGKEYAKQILEKLQ